MKAKRFSEEQVIAVLKEAGGRSEDKGAVPAARDLGSNVLQLEGEVRGGMTVSEARRLKDLEAENGKLKRLLADAELEKAALKDLLGRKW